MGIFSDNVRKYWEYGLQTIPVGEGKKPVITGWQEFSNRKLTEDEVEIFENKYVNEQRIGLVLGPASGVVHFDFDYKYDEKKVKMSKEDFLKEKKIIEKEIKRILPKTPCERITKNGDGGFYKYNPSLLNKSCNKSNVRLFDFLVEKRQVLIPPSLHSDDFYYEWKGSPLYECLDDLPEISQDIIEELSYLFGEKIEKSEPTRHDALFFWALQILEIENDRKKIAQAMVKKDISLHKIPYLSDPKHFKNTFNDPISNAEKWLERVSAYKLSKSVTATLNPESADFLKQLKLKAKTDYDSFEFFFSEHLMDAKREKLTNELIYIDNDNKWIPVVNELSQLRSYAHSKKLSKNYTEDHLMRYWNNMEKELLLDFVKWDRVNRLDPLFSSIKFKGEKISQDQSVDLLKYWCVGIFKRLENPMNQNYILVLRGQQGIGKDTFITKVFREAFQGYFANIEPQEKNIENYLNVYGKLIANISEFDQTNKVVLGCLKNLITTDRQRFRSPYGRSSQDHDFYCSFIASSNFDDILRDTTGNRRFMILDLESINWEYEKYINGPQILAEMKHLYDSGFTASNESLEALKSVIEDETPESLDGIAIERIMEIIKDVEAQKAINPVTGLRYEVRWSDIEHKITNLARALGISVFRMQSIIKRHGFQRRNENFRWYESKPLKTH